MCSVLFNHPNSTKFCRNFPVIRVKQHSVSLSAPDVSNLNELAFYRVVFFETADETEQIKNHYPKHYSAE